MPKKKENEIFIAELREKAPDVLPLASYTGSTIKIKCMCKKCGNIWLVAPQSLLSGKGCPACSRKQITEKRKYTTEVFAEKLSLIQPEIEIVGDYINSQTKIEVHCKKCNNRWFVVPSSLLHGTGCPKCNKRFRKDTAAFIEELNSISPHITVLGQYKNAHQKLLVKCNRCGTEWNAVPQGLLRGNDCPCCGHSQTSIVEQVLYESFCLLFGTKKVLNRDKSIIGKELDICIPHIGLAIEYGAWYWHSKRLQKDIEKERLCERLGIHLITIYEGCPKETVTGDLKNAVCYTTVISSEKNFDTVQDIIIQISQDYRVNPSIVIKQWDSIVKKAKEETRRKDAEQFSKELSTVNPSIKYLGKYSGSKNQVYVMCKQCGTKWLASSAYDLLHGHGCPECAKIQRSASQLMSPEAFRERVSLVNPDIELLEEYNGLRTSILCRCKKCGTEWNPKPDSILYKRRNCPTCSPLTKKTNAQFLKELALVSSTVLPLEDYKNLRTSMRFVCKVCDYEWITTPGNVLQGTGCPRCAHRINISHEEFITRLQDVTNSISIIGEYVDSKTRVKCRCKTCGYEWYGLPNNLLRGAGCQRCAGTLRLTNEEFLRRLASIKQSITPLEPYVDSHTKILCECNVCNYTWKAAPGNLLRGHGCPSCKANKARTIRQRKVKCIETNQIYDSVYSAKQETGITTISDCLNHRIKTAGGYHWVYLEL